MIRDDDEDKYDVERYDSAIGWGMKEEEADAKRRAKALAFYERREFSVFIVDRGDEIYERAEELPSIKGLFGMFWQSRQIAVLFGEPGLGKSVLAVQIGMSIAEETSIEPFKSCVPSGAVLYLDFELTHRQFADRYTDTSGDVPIQYSLHPNFCRAYDHWQGQPVPKPFDTDPDYLYHSIRNSINETEASALIIDNISFMGLRQFSAQRAFALFQKLRLLRDELGTSILLLAHTPKRSEGLPLTFKDVQGSTMLSGIADSVFAIGRGRGRNIRYLKHIKARSTDLVHDENNVVVYSLEKRPIEPDVKIPPLAFHHTGFSTEAEQLGQRITDKYVLIDRVKQLHESGMSLRDIGRRLHVSHMKVDRLLKGENSDEV